MTPYKEEFAAETSGELSPRARRRGRVRRPFHLAHRQAAHDPSMAKDPIVFAMANPDPEIPYDDAVAARRT